MKRFISNSQLFLLFGCVIIVAHTAAAPPEEVQSAFIAHRQRQREARRLAKAGPRLPAEKGIGLEDDTSPFIEYSMNWAGAIQSPPPFEIFNSVSAQWVVPTPSPPPSANGAGTWYFSAWVGIDGSSCRPELPGILQAGTSSWVNVTNAGVITTGAFAWSEWYPHPELQISGITVSGGDTVQFSVQAASNSRGTASVTNLNTTNSTTIYLQAPDNSHLCRQDAEWVVEDFDIGGEMAPFANFTTVNFQDCKATTTIGSTVNLQNATLHYMVQSKVLLATATEITPTILQVQYTG